MQPFYHDGDIESRIQNECQCCNVSLTLKMLIKENDALRSCVVVFNHLILTKTTNMNITLMHTSVVLIEENICWYRIVA